VSTSEPVERTVFVFYRVREDGRAHHYQASYLRTYYRGARPGEDLVRQVEFVGYCCRIEPGERLSTVKELRQPRQSQEELEREVRTFLAARHGTTPDRVEEVARHAFP